MVQVLEPQSCLTKLYEDFGKVFPLSKVKRNGAGVSVVIPAGDMHTHVLGC